MWTQIMKKFFFSSPFFQMQFKEHKMGEGKLVEDPGSQPKAETSKDLIHDIFCVPLYTMMLALNRTRIDYFSLDVEGFELDLLRTIPFHLLDIPVFSVEMKHNKEGVQAIVDFMSQRGYRIHSKLHMFKPEIYFGCNDYVFIKNGFRSHQIGLAYTKEFPIKH